MRAKIPEVLAIFKEHYNLVKTYMETTSNSLKVEWLPTTIWAICCSYLDEFTVLLTPVSSASYDYTKDPRRRHVSPSGLVFVY